jgi:two-component system chemotaxis sensor kinase CheA
MTIRHRIILLIVLTFAALAAIGGYAVVKSRAGALDVQRVTAGVFPSALASSDLVAEVKDLQIATMVLVYAPDQNMVAESGKALARSEAALRDALTWQADRAVGQAQIGLISQAKESLTNYFAAISDTQKFKEAGKNDMAQAYLYANVAQYRDELEGIVETLRTEKNRQKDAAFAALNRSLATTTTTISIVSVFAIALLSLIGAVLYRQIVYPLSRMQKMMSDVASHQDFTRRLPVTGNDEIAQSMLAFNEMIAKIQLSASQLKQKSADVQAMLQNMQQGILTIVNGADRTDQADQADAHAFAGGVTHPEYSAHMESIFQTSDIAGRPVMSLIFSDTNLGSDTLSQIEAAIDACLGEDAMNFVFNRHLFVNEITKRMPDGTQKILDLSWSGITNEDDVVVRLMLCVRDVTELRQLAEEAGEQKRHLEMIGEILTVSQDKFDDFIHSATRFINANEKIIRETSQVDHDAIAALFRNMHTVKGNARTYKLQHLTDIVHETEQSYEALRQPQPDRSWDQDDLMKDLIRVREAVARYAEINTVSLGRSKGAANTNGTSANVTGLNADDGERYLLAEKQHIEGSLRLLEGITLDDAPRLVSIRDAVRQTLRLIGTQSVADMLSGVVASLPSLAMQLGKASPIVHIDDNGYRLHRDMADLLQNVFVHLLRNAIDHGIESPAQRAAAGKTEAGTISIEVGVDDKFAQLTLSDDGHGLALDHIRHIAIKKGLLAGHARPSDSDIANLIFAAGFSTAATVSDVSGRGVGMDAVSNFLKQHGGHIALRFTDTHVGAAYRRFQTIVSLPAEVAVDSLGDDNNVRSNARTLAANITIE